VPVRVTESESLAEERLLVKEVGRRGAVTNIVAVESIAPVQSKVRSVRWLFIGLAVAGALLTAVGSPERNGSPAASRPFTYGIAMLLLGGLGSAYFLLWQANQRLLVGRDQLGYTDALGRPHVWSASQVAAIVDVSISYSPRAPARRYVYFLGVDGHRLMMINPTPWPDSAIDRLARAAGRSVQIRATPVSPAEFKREFPDAMSWMGTHSTLAGGLLALGLGIIVLGLVVASGWIRW
jgi:hypothetical protein